MIYRPLYSRRVRDARSCIQALPITRPSVFLTKADATKTVDQRDHPMTTDYDKIAERYRQAKRQPWRSAIEAFTLLELTGDLTGRSVVDLACGEGHYTRILRQHGASKIVGVDLSEGMIELARAQEAAAPMGIDYVVQDGRKMELAEQFELAVAAYLLNYAKDRADLKAMCKGVARCLKPGGRFVTANTNPDLDFDRIDAFTDYGFDVEWTGELSEGTPITWVFNLPDGPLRVENYHLDKATHEEALKAAGFRDVRWHKPRLSPRGEASHEPGYWDSFLAQAPVIFIECVK
jgi:ubiquinone/menaquinone biosynthesis C-methylase UbiE